MRPCPDSAALRLAFTRTEQRTQEERRHHRHRRPPLRGPGPLSPSHPLEVRYAGWDLSHVHLVDPRTGNVLCRSIRRTSRQRQRLAPRARSRPPERTTRRRVAQHRAAAAELIDEHAATGLPPAYLPKDEHRNAEGDDQ